ncbi:hypothetical protein HMI54_011318 [Coelomomyces lativittatus]|nr:hypothetical protein HMI55_004865 [Coelomomyces lativittatus]KAJ1499860.1 hypothetical protein HMI54_011318 [Coelomomyces lativittatus]KAJ1502509.1 hypothetical protein HMI56_002647 [Coelomomyces lativittatus]
MRMQLMMNDILLYDIIQKYPVIFRPPYLEYNTTILNLLETMGYTTVSTNVNSRDFMSSTTDMVISNVMNDVKLHKNIEGMMILFDDGFQISLDALSTVVTNLKKEGLTIVDLPTCLNKPMSALYRSSESYLFNKDPNWSAVIPNVPQLNPGNGGSSSSSGSVIDQGVGAVVNQGEKQGKTSWITYVLELIGLGLATFGFT